MPKAKAAIDGFGRPPELDENSSRTDVIQALNYYAYHETERDPNYVCIWMEQNGYCAEDVKLVRDYGKNRVPHRIARMLFENPRFQNNRSLDLADTLKYAIVECVEYGRAAKQQKKVEVSSASRRIHNSCIADLDCVLDAYYRSNYKTVYPIPKHIKEKKYTVKERKEALAYYKELAEEVSEQNSYQLQLKRIISFLEIKKPRKPRKKKKKPAKEIVKNLKFLPFSEVYKIPSILPTDILVSERVWLFNEHSRVLSLLTAIKGEKLTVKGTTINNIDKSKCVCKKLRKPEEILPKIQSMGRRQVMRVFNEIRAKEGSATPRTNDRTLIIRSY